MRVWILSFLLLLAGCHLRQRPAPVDTYTALGAHLTLASQAQTQAASYWDQLIIGTGLDCQQGFPTLPPFSLTISDTTANPIRDQLNQAITLLQQAATIWDAICADPSPSVTPQSANQGYLLVKQAGEALETAQVLYAAWNP